MKRLRLLKRVIRLCLMRLPLENIADNVRKIALVFIPAGAVGLVVTGDKIIVFEALSMISGGNNLHFILINNNYFRNKV